MLRIDKHILESVSTCNHQERSKIFLTECWVKTLKLNINRLRVIYKPTTW